MEKSSIRKVLIILFGHLWVLNFSLQVDTRGNLLPVSLTPAANDPNVIFMGLGGKTIHEKTLRQKISVADTVCLSQILICSIPDSGSASKILSILTQKNGI
jgi:hypothetical protein